MTFPFVDYLDTLFAPHKMVKLLTKAEYASLERVRRGEAGIMSLSESFLADLRAAVAENFGESEAQTFDMRLTRCYTAYNLRFYAERLEDVFNRRSWLSWLSESRTISPPALTRVQHIVGIDVTQRPVEKKRGQPKAGEPKLKTVRLHRYEKLVEVVKSPENTFRLQKLVTSFNFADADFCIYLFNKEDFVTITIDEDCAPDSDFIDVETNEDNFVESFDSYKQALTLALDNLEEIIEGREEDEETEPDTKGKVVAAKGKPAVPVAPSARLLNALRATDTDDVENYGGFKTLSAFTYHILDVDKCAVLRIRVNEGENKPYTMESLSGRKHGSFASETSVLSRAWQILEELLEEDEDDLDDEDEEDDRPPTKIKAKPEPKKAKRSVPDEDSADEDYPNLFSALTIARCPHLMVFSNRRSDLMSEADGEEDEVSGLYGTLRIIAEHSLTRIMSAYWPNSFEFDLTDEDEEAPEFTLNVEPFKIIFEHESITVVQRYRNGETTFRQRVNGSQTVRQRLDIAMGYFDTWDDGRITTMLEDTGFMHNSGNGVVFRTDDTEFSVVERPATPELFYSPDDVQVDQIASDGMYHQLSEFLRDEVNNVRGVQFGHNGESRYTLILSGECVMDLVAVNSRTRHADHIQLVADADASTAFYAGLHEGDFDLNSLRNKGMVVTETPNIVTLEFNYMNKGFLVHVYQ